MAAYIRRQPIARAAIKKLSSLMRWLVPLYVQEGKSYLTVAIGCTGGRHRSVYVAEALKRELSDVKGVSIKLCAPRPGEETMIGVVVVTHGQLATELVNAAETIVGDLPNFAAVSIGWHEDVQDARDAIASAIERVKQPGGVLLATDMFGGTPSNLGITFLATGQDRDRHRCEPADADQGGQPQGGRVAHRDCAHAARARAQCDLGGVRLTLGCIECGTSMPHRAPRRNDDRECVIRNQLGLHARAAAKFVHTATRYASQIRVSRDGRTMDGKSIMGILLLAAAAGTTVVITAEGADEADAVDALCRLVEGGFGEELWSV